MKKIIIATLLLLVLATLITSCAPKEEPIRTQAEAREFIERSHGLTCNESIRGRSWEGTTDYPTPLQEYYSGEESFLLYGYPGIMTFPNGSLSIVHLMLFDECRQIQTWEDAGLCNPENPSDCVWKWNECVNGTCYRAKSGTFTFVFRIDPNTKWIQQFTCNYNLPDMVDLCPKDENGTYIWINRPLELNPNYELYLSLDIPTRTLGVPEEQATQEIDIDYIGPDHPSFDKHKLITE